ncbi:DUF2231 domain-containing protein [Aeromicrobium sp. 9AM]|uniref:DUF2231 domain-containing protein n=1 Tax=Aeromicrobium sp. 9AM TaxID=2653126 RepID=UPI0012EF6281|nr:DUF2231 domain-containing protein [Aeromicrobium sp. 9AM]VXA93786.1 conserved membrane hypothetical protein [Aeromicrobium sp. 9AM]
MPNDFRGLPLHPLIVHATVVIVPLAALTVLLAALWPRFRGWAGPLPAGLSLVGLILVPLSTSTGETLERHVPHSALLERHTHLADGLLPWMIGLLAVAVVGYALHRRPTSISRAVPIVVAVLTVVAVVGTTVQVVRIGESGAKAAWAGTDMTR